MGEFLDPTDSVARPRAWAPRLPDLEGRAVALLDISKAKGDFFLDRVADLLRAEARPRVIVRRVKPAFARPAPEALREELLASCDAVIVALAD